MPFFYLIFVLFWGPKLCFAVESVMETRDQKSLFSGRVVRINENASLIRVKVDFKNSKFINKSDQISFFTDTAPEHKCNAYVKAKANGYILLKIPEIGECKRRVYFSTGAYLYFTSEDLKKNLLVADEVVRIMQLKRVAVSSSLERKRKELHTFIEQVEAVNQRYKVLRDKLNLEWQKELTQLEIDKSNILSDYKNLELRLGEIEHKLEQYRIHDNNLEDDRWALDSRLYIKK